MELTFISGSGIISSDPSRGISAVTIAAFSSRVLKVIRRV